MAVSGILCKDTGVRIIAIICSVCAGIAFPAIAGDLQPFRMPWNDATPGITNLQHWLSQEAGAAGWVTVSPEGHYVIGDQRMRFLGVNVTAADAFPAREQAEGHAARLARFGFNSVRFHHLEAPWAKQSVLVDYDQGNSREISADRLDRLHYFIAQLAQRGIYTDLNLLVSREFQASDGLGEEIARMEWKDQHILGFFNDDALALHKEYALKVLTAPNPYRGDLPMANDPAVAFVEIMNENGLLQKWHEGVLDKMPEIYRDQLRLRWNGWLRERYESTSAMMNAWDAIDQPLGENRLINGDFRSGLYSWGTERHSGAQATFASTDDFNGSPSMRIEVTTPGGANWHVQLNQRFLPIQEGTVYTLRYWAKAESPTPLSAAIQRAHTDWATLAPALNVTLDGEWREYQLTFQNTITEANARVNFNGFGDRKAVVWIADVRFQEGGKIGALPDGTSLEDGTVPNLAAGGTGATMGQRLDWVRCMIQLEKNYWNEMRRYIKEDLAYPGIVFATIVSNSPPNAQTGMDAYDSHSYWQHPIFPTGQEWSPVNWTVQNVSMVNDRNAGGIGSIARQRVAGRPHNATEYQHSSPNTYAAEGPVLAAAYGALQDWDGIWFFEYKTGTQECVTGFFDHGGHPGRMANNLLAAALFLRGDAAPAITEHRMRFDPEREVELAATRGRAWSVADGSHLGLTGAHALASRLALVLDPETEALDELPAPPEPPVIASDTGELTWDNSIADKGVVTINTPRTKAVAGFKGDRTFDLGGVVIDPGSTVQDWSTIGITLLEGDSFDTTSAARAVIVATGEYANTDMFWKDESRTSVGARWGTAPAMVEVVPARITLPWPADRVKVWWLNGLGERQDKVAVESADSKAVILLGNRGATLWYEVEVAEAAPVEENPEEQP